MLYKANVCAFAAPSKSEDKLRGVGRPTAERAFQMANHKLIFVGGMEEADVVVVGGGLAGLSCAKALVEAGYRVILTEARDRLVEPIFALQFAKISVLQVGWPCPYAPPFFWAPRGVRGYLGGS